MRLLYFASLLCHVITTPAVAGASGVTSKLFIHVPKSLSRKGGYDHQEAFFGVPPYGRSIQQNVYYANQTLCNSDVDTHKGYPERPTGDDGKMESWPSPYILMVDLNGCTFVTKVRNAQRSGAAAVIIADTTCLCHHTTCKQDAECESAELMMADDGSGSDISIPSFLMYMEDADLVKEAVKSNQPVQAEMVWALPSEGDIVEYDLWTTPSDIISREFLYQFKSAAMALSGHATFTPRNYIFDGIKSGCQGLDQCYTLCTNNGRYCATVPDNDLEKGISGADVVTESLRRICIWNKYGTDGVGKPWWDYIEEFMYRCDTEEFFASIDCAKDAMKHAGVDFQVVANCVSDSGGLQGDRMNVFLEKELAEKDAMGVVIVPTMYINKTPIRGALSFATVFKAICAGFAVGTTPSICQLCASCSNQQECIKAGGSCPMHTGHNGSFSTHTFLLSLLLLTGLFAGLGAWHYKRTREDMREQVRGILAEYMPLEDHDEGLRSTTRTCRL